jgi:GNAT superfamily N-acetyltransferase
MIYKKTINGVLYSNDKKLLQINTIHRYLSEESYWAKGISLRLVKNCIKGSECFAAYLNHQQIAFARVINDGASFGYLADVFVSDAFRGKGISKQLIAFIMEYPGFKGFRRFMLATKDAHTLYEKFGFRPLATPERFMEIKPFENYYQK